MALSPSKQLSLILLLVAMVTVAFPLWFSKIVNEKNCLHTESSLKCVKYIRNYDGDTVRFDIQGIHPLVGENIAVRMAGIDAPEIRTLDPCEKKLGKKAKKRVAQVLKGAKRIDLVHIRRGKYFRIIADVIADKTNVGQILLAEGLAYRYRGGKKPKIDWCSKGAPLS